MTSEVEACLHAFTREAYAGGRCEVIRERFDGQKDVSATVDPERYGRFLLNYGDYNSMYAWAMQGDMPIELSTRGRVTASDIGFVRCTVSIPPDCYLPPLPFRHEDKLIFPVGTFSGTWTSAELSLLPEVGGEVLSIDKEVWFQGRPLFDEYVHDWYTYRHTKDAFGNPNPTKSLIGKQYLTNLYGKFGQTPEREKLYFYPSDEELAEHVLIPLPNVPPSMGAFGETTTDCPPYVIPRIAAWITSRARARLWRTMADLISQGYKVYYCDTDSVVTDGPVAYGTALGDLKLECQVKRARFVAPKLYFMETLDKGGIVKAKGFTGGFGGKGLTEAEFNALVDHRQTVKVKRMTKLREGIRSKKRFPAMKHVIKGLREGILDEKRIHLEDGDTRPIDVTGVST